MGRASLLALAALAGACSSNGTLNVQLELTNKDCVPTDLEQIAVMSVEVWGSNGDGKVCTMGKRCLFDVDVPDQAMEVADLTTKLHDAEQPLIDIDPGTSKVVAVIGRVQEQGCFGTQQPVACGQADLADVSGGSLEIVMRCGGSCPTDAWDQCP